MKFWKKTKLSQNNEHLGPLESETKFIKPKGYQEIVCKVYYFNNNIRVVIDLTNNNVDIDGLKNVKVIGVLPVEDEKLHKMNSFKRNY